MIAGSLEIQMLAGIARLQTDMNQAKSVVGTAMQNIERSVGLAKTALGALGVGLSINYFVEMIKGSIDAMDHLNDLSKATNVAVEDLAGLKLAAKQSGGDLDSIAASLNKLAQNMGKDAEKFKALGITARDPLEAFKQLADIFRAIEDPQMRAALGAATLGKSWAGAAPLLSEGSKRIGEMVARGTELSKVNKEMAERADEFNDRLAELKTVGEGAKNIFVDWLLPSLTNVTRAIIEARTQSGLLMAAWVALGGVGAFLFTDQTLSSEQLMAKNVSELNDRIKIQEQRLKEANDIVGPYGENLRKAISYGLEGAKAQLAAIEASKRAVEDKKKIKEIDDQLDAALFGGDAEDRAAAFLDDGKAASAYKSELASLTKQIADLNGQGQLEAYILKLNEESFKTLTVEQKAHLIELEKTIIAKKQLIETTKSEIQAAIELLKIQDQITDGTEDYLQALRDADEQQQFEISLIGKTADEVAKLTEMRRRDLELLKAVKALGPNATSADVQLLIDANKAAKDRVGILMDTGAALRTEISILDSLSTTFGNFIVSFQHGWKGAMDYARNLLKQLLAELVAFFAKRWFLQMVVGATGGAGMVGSAAASSLGSMGSSVMGAGLNAAGSYLGASLFGTAASVATSSTVIGAGSGMMLGTAAGEGAIIAGTSGAIGAGGITASITSALAAIPIWGWIAIAAMAAYAAFGGKGGGPKSGGSFQGMFDASGLQTGTNATPLFGLTQAENVAAGPVGQLATTTAAAYYALVNKLGGNAKALSFGLGFDTDPRGTAQNRVMAYVRDALGNTLFAENNREIGRDEKNIGPELQLTASRALLAALQASDIPKEIADVLNSVSAAAGTQEEITAILRQATELKMMMDGLAASGLKGLDVAALKAMAAEGETLAQTYERVGKTYAAFVDSFTSDSDKLKASTDALTKLWADMGIAAPATNEAYMNIVKGLDLSTESGRSFFNQLMELAPAFQSVKNSVASMIGSIQASITSIYGGQFGAQFARGALDAAVRALNAFVGLPSSYDAQTIADLISGVNTQYIIDLINAPGTDPALISLLQTLLSAFGNWQGALNANTTTTTTNTGTIVDNTAAIAAALAQAKAGIGDYLQKSLLSNLSPLTPMQQLAEARRQYESNLSLAQGGDVNALQNYGATRDAYLAIARQIYASSGAYNDIFNSTFMQGNALAGTNFTPYGLQDAVAQTSRIVDAIQANSVILSDLMNRLNEPLPVQDAALAAAQEKTATQLATSKPGALTSGTATLS